MALDVSFFLLGLNVNTWSPGVVLADPFAVADFKSGAYTINGSAMTVADMFVQNNDWSSFDPSACIVNGTGLVGNGNDWPTLKSTFAADMIANGVTIKATVQIASAGANRLFFELLDLPGYSTEIKAIPATGGGVTTLDSAITDGTTSMGAAGTEFQSYLWLGKNVMAFNLSTGDLSMSKNGDDGFGFDPIDGSPTNIVIGINPGLTIEKLEFFTLQDRADLYAYSFHGAPHNDALPVITGTPQVGQTLSCSTGDWSNTPTSFEYSWEQVGSGQYGTDQTFVVDPALVGFSVTCGVTAVNAEGRVLATSVAVGPVIAA